MFKITAPRHRARGADEAELQQSGGEEEPCVISLSCDDIMSDGQLDTRRKNSAN